MLSDGLQLHSGPTVLGLGEAEVMVLLVDGCGKTCSWQTPSVPIASERSQFKHLAGFERGVHGEMDGQRARDSLESSIKLLGVVGGEGERYAVRNNFRTVLMMN